MPFGLCNAPAIFQGLMHEVFQDYIDRFLVVYLDDILVFSKTLEEHQHHVTQVLEKLRQHGLYAKLEKCAFHQTSVEFLGLRVSSSGLTMSEEKVQAIREWPQPSNTIGILSFLGFTNFYRRFINNYSAIARPLTELTKKSATFTWTPSANSAFLALKSAVSSAPTLIHPDSDQPFQLSCDASDFALGAVLSQVPRGFSIAKPQPVAFYSRKFLPAEINYTVMTRNF